jgi:hypothetical protein
MSLPNIISLSIKWRHSTKRDGFFRLLFKKQPGCRAYQTGHAEMGHWRAHFSISRLNREIVKIQTDAN